MRDVFLICGFSSTTDRLEDEIKLNLTADKIAEIAPRYDDDPEFAHVYPLSDDATRALLKMSGIGFSLKYDCEYFLHSYRPVSTSHK